MVVHPGLPFGHNQRPHKPLGTPNQGPGATPAVLAPCGRNKRCRTVTGSGIGTAWLQGAGGLAADAADSGIGVACQRGSGWLCPGLNGPGRGDALGRLATHGLFTSICGPDGAGPSVGASGRKTPSRPAWFYSHRRCFMATRAVTDPDVGGKALAGRSGSASPRTQGSAGRRGSLDRSAVKAHNGRFAAGDIRRTPTGGV